jgi:thymidine phosphorylase
MLNVINDGSALEILFRMIYEHGGDLKKIKTLNKYNLEITSKKEGYLKYTNTKIIGNAVNYITILNGKKDINAGVQFFKKNGDYLYKGDSIYRIFANNYENVQVAKKMIQTSYLINMEQK